MKVTFFSLLLVSLPLLSTASLEPAGHTRPRHHRRARNLHADPSYPSDPTLYSRDLFGDRPRIQPRSRPGAAIAKNYTALADEVFDYVIAGGGTAGLALAGRLSEDPDVTVAVIEAGHSGYSDDEAVLVPGNAYFKSSVGSDLDWQYVTANQSKLQDADGNSRTTSWPRGKVLGGSSAINGMYYVAPTKREHQVWGRLSGDIATWGWHNLRDAMRKSTSFTPNTIKQLDTSISNQTDFVGEDGPIALTYPGVSYQPVADWVPTLAALGIDHADSPYDGDNQGAFIATSTINSKNWERCFSRNAYLDPIASKRKNLVVLPNQTVTRIIWDTEADENGDRRALGVEFAASPDAPRVHVTARREVILSAGAIGSPQILQLSGFGCKELLEKHNVTLVKELPGVGQNLQDHLTTAVTYTPADGLVLPTETNLTKQASFVDSSVAYVTLDKLYGANETSNFIARAKKFSVDYIKSATNVPEAVRRGWAKQYKFLLEDLLTAKSDKGFTGGAKGAMEMLLGISNGKQVMVETALQAPFSRGWVEISSKNPFDKPIINPNYLQHRSDVELMRSGVQLARKIGTTAPLSSVMGGESLPGSAVVSDEDVDKYVAQTAQTESHPSSTCSMLDEDDGGVVDNELRVYGTSNVRVVDASVVPISLSSHLMSTTYAIAEIAADLIKADPFELIDECDWDGENEAAAASMAEEDCDEEK
ncbi:Glucose-methanol-choline oxidoreductase, C-terminal [Kalmanozyma brasiliensis GHG001]|uniref:Choline dehydrogenase n=1 Tax=Kalmanozyma brasiliensis (strain GHG001) TaxID=1365824 RepID=V5EVT3_KALBG|nr:Glucose-methanol-choline oxidoreductase, C-terminal [Kalmanozyma brasiliensis GHG001]EST09590.1 Glucose-methanol-choline oxidoreductase, C-terminal [Kalmanozyma brasiliensis GHG001]